METGPLFIAGGATTHHFDRMLKALIEAAGGPQHKFALIVSASGDGPDETFREYQKDFARMGVSPGNVVLIPLYDPDVRDERGFNALNGDRLNRCMNFPSPAAPSAVRAPERPS